MCAALLVLSVIELGVVHLLVAHWSRAAALILSVISGAGLVYLVALIASFRSRPVLLTRDAVCVRAGFAAGRSVPLADIAAVDADVTGDIVRDPATLNLALLAWPNIVLTLRTPISRGKRRAPVTRIAFRLDDPAPFMRALRDRRETAEMGDGAD